jgi:hypothetical protein
MCKYDKPAAQMGSIFAELCLKNTQFAPQVFVVNRMKPL